ncbi:MAG: excinuclease ABC subunit UvrC [Gammaproteobacteria bacterium]
MNSEFLKKLAGDFPENPGVYIMRNAQSKIIYVGKAKNLKKRVSSYFLKTPDPKTEALLKQVVHLEFTITRTEQEALLLENNLIKIHQPKYNIILKDDKSYPYLVLDLKSDFPRIALYRGKREKEKTIKTKNSVSEHRYFGPYASAKQVRESMDSIFKIFKIRSCSDLFFKNRTRPCLQYQIQRCSAPCVGYVSIANYAENIQNLIQFLEGSDHVLLKNWQIQMQEASKNQDYQAAADFRDKIQNLRQLQKDQVIYNHCGNLDIIDWIQRPECLILIILKIRNDKLQGLINYSADLENALEPFNIQDFMTGEYQVYQGLESGVKVLFREDLKNSKNKEYQKLFEIMDLNLQEALKSYLEKRKPNHLRWQDLEKALGRNFNKMHCVDISHHQGEATVAAFVVFDATGPLKKEYRKMQLGIPTGGDDYAALAWALEKYASNGMALENDLICIDGGKGQLGVALAFAKKLGLDESNFISISKGEGRKDGLETIHLPRGGVLDLENTRPAFHLLQHARDEAHAFAIGYHRKQKNKNRLKSILEQIPGIGPKRRRLLLDYFGGIQGLKQASIEEITRVPGFNRDLARRLYEHLKAS